jgi:hypothetical protein
MRFGLSRHAPSPRKGKLGGAFTGTVQDEHLMLEHQRLSGNYTNTAWSHQLRQRGQQMRYQYE